ncbi:16S rRNA (guanine(527)-N(7))-methyltransferase RsmG [Propylenella binzhouense]|uniref:Ribosomal RNA small subunit methyltransferase G n=1 Tax=Propylenella binzhouense TaxID=2555902 RepID=A0A964T2N9_9HYPH|nr:16S rRNA (guanine(527)-N(7))-methyltransferase RsmG [Propylenella binzhouense]MYZ46832.1 16S rRNA (guanine(527)-N(7))-methyltransferase RsmG [Propylenella binzhouense]
MRSAGEADGPASLDRFPFVTSEARARLIRFAGLLARWQATHNLVSRSGLGDLWTRHIADSVQLLPLAPSFRSWFDLGSGAGFPGLIIAILLAHDGNRRFTLVEANQKKAAFLRAAVRETGAHAEVASERIEQHSILHKREADVVSARALAPFSELAALAFPYLHDRSVFLMPKGQDFEREDREAALHWQYDLSAVPSLTDPQGRLVTVRHLRPRTGA